MVTFIQPPSLGDGATHGAHSHSHDHGTEGHSHGHEHDHAAFNSTAPGGQRGADGLTDRERLIRDHGHDHSGMEFVGETFTTVALVGLKYTETDEIYGR